MPILNLDTLEVGDTISFRSVNPLDNVLWQGTITGICSYDIVQNLRDDLLPYYREVKKTIHDMLPIDQLTYFTLKYFQGDKVGRLVMAKDWIEPSSVKKIDITNYFDIRIYDLDSAQAQTILELLTSNNFKAALV